MKRQDAINQLRAHRQELVDRFGISTLYLFGSVARDDARSSSDIDLLVEFTKPVGLFHFIELQQSLEATLGSKVDLGTRRSLKSRLKDEVLQDAIRVA